MPATRRHHRRSVRFLPLDDFSAVGPDRLERRLLLSVVPASQSAPHHPGHVRSTATTTARPGEAHNASSRVTPAQEINKQYNQFVSNLEAVGTSYTQALSEQSTGTVSVSTTLTAPYAAGAATMNVVNAGVFGPEGIFSTPVTATALVGSVPVGTFSLTGSSGNVLIVNPAQSDPIPLSSGTTLTATVTSSASTSAGSIFPSYITTSTEQLAINLVAYFNNLPFRLPRMYALPHQDQRAGAIQQYVYQLVAGNASTSLRNTLNAIALPQTPGGDLQIYTAAATAAIEGSRTQMLSGVKLIFAGKLPVVPTSSSSSSTTTTTGTSSSSSTSGTGSTTT